MRYPALHQNQQANYAQQEQQQQPADLYYIIGGDEVDNDQFWPWSVAIYELDPLNGQRQFICSGSLISERFVLTAAHCIQQSRFDILSPDEVFLKIASVRLDDEHSSFHRVESVFVHPEYSVDRKANDIALLKLTNSQRLPPRARPICLPSHVANRIDFTDQQVTIIGWGKTNAMQGDEPSRLIDITTPDPLSALDAPDQPNVQGNELGGGDGESKKSTTAPTGDDGETSDQQSTGERSITEANETLLQAEVRVTSTDQCNRNYSKLEISWLNIDEHFLCASDPMGKRDACQGDSGGPLMWNNQQHSSPLLAQEEKWYQLGLVSFGHGCANKQFPGVYTRISYYMPWILKIVNGRSGNPNTNHHLQDNQQQQQHQQQYGNQQNNHHIHHLPYQSSATGGDGGEFGRAKWRR